MYTYIHFERRLCMCMQVSVIDSFMIFLLVKKNLPRKGLTESNTILSSLPSYFASFFCQIWYIIQSFKNCRMKVSTVNTKIEKK